MKASGVRDRCRHRRGRDRCVDRCRRGQHANANLTLADDGLTCFVTGRLRDSLSRGLLEIILSKRPLSDSEPKGRGGRVKLVRRSLNGLSARSRRASYLAASPWSLTRGNGAHGQPIQVSSLRGTQTDLSLLWASCAGSIMSIEGSEVPAVERVSRKGAEFGPQQDSC